MKPQLFVSTRKGLFTFEPNGDGSAPKWNISRTAFLADNVTIVTPDRRTGRIYAALDHGHFGCKMHRSLDGGNTWEECAAPAYPPMPEGYEEPVNPFAGRAVPWTLKLIWSLEPGGADQPGLLWCGTLPGGLFRSDDGGDTWNLVRTLWDNPKRTAWFGGGAEWPGIHSICVDPRDSRRVLLGVSCGGVWVTPDAGETWECHADGMRAAYMPPEQAGDPNIQDPHRLAQCRNAPERLWVQHHNGIFRSTDDARSWHEIEIAGPSTFGFAVAVHPNDPDTAWFVPAISDEKRIPADGKVVVTRTRDGGKSFEVLSRGLPHRHAYDLTFRHALDIDETGNTLAFGSTTGSVWFTEDQGDTWQQIASHLPPVYSVRFA